MLDLPCEYKKSPTHSRSFLRALRRGWSFGGRPRDDRTEGGELRHFRGDVATTAGEVSDVVDALSRDD